MSNGNVEMTIVAKLHAPTFSVARMLSLTDLRNRLKNINFPWNTQRSTRAAFLDLSERELRDISLTRTDVNALDTTAKWAKNSRSRIMDRH